MIYFCCEELLHNFLQRYEAMLNRVNLITIKDIPEWIRADFLLNHHSAYGWQKGLD